MHAHADEHSQLGVDDNELCSMMVSAPSPLRVERRMPELSAINSHSTLSPTIDEYGVKREGYEEVVVVVVVGGGGGGGRER